MTATAFAGASYASEIDAFSYGEYHPNPARCGPTFHGRIQPSAAAGRYHLYLGWASIPSHHTAILRTLLGLDGAVSLSYVDTLRDGRGWAFRNRSGPDMVNGFTLLRQAYELSDPDFAGEVQVPLLWDRETRSVTSDDPQSITTDLLDWAGVPRLANGPAVSDEVARLERAFVAELDPVAALRDPGRRAQFRRELTNLDRRLSGIRYLAGAALSDADVRLWVRLARLDAGPNASGVIGPRLDRYPHLWRWATTLWSMPAFRSNTHFQNFAAPFADLPPWPLGAELGLAE
ncbi:MAG: glutathionyl-hydroquinone reductase [Pseudonocardiales bacterium]|nr:glutathionyl-hydroquinone reductase [Pseudonocardiales bacterium]